MSKVLIVDDEKSIRNSLKEFLLDEEYKVESAADAKECLQLLGEHAFDIVVSDIVLPEINGIELLDAIRAAAPGVQVIMITGEPTVDTAAAALRAGAFDYLTKPVGKNGILRAVGNAAKVKAVDDERRRLERENQHYRDKLEKLVEQRTAELHKAMEDLKQAQSEIIRHERLNALGQLASGICHDFNNVLMPIHGLADYLASHPETLEDKTETMRLIRTIQSASDDAKEIVRRMREFYRPRETLDMEAVAADSLLSDVVDLTRPRWQTRAQGEGRSIRVHCEATDAPSILGNAAQLREALTNLALNAVDAMPEGGTILLRAEQEGDMAAISVTDTGDGMPEEIRNRCLEPFFSTKGEGGTGMGLAMVHGIVKRHNGSMEIQSALSKGTTIRLRLPLAGKERTGRHIPERPAERASEHLRILVVDDEEWCRELLAKYLGDAGHTVELAPAGGMGLTKAIHTSFDIVITDRAMPGMNGDQVAAQLKEKFPHLPVVLLTGDITHDTEHVPKAVDAVLEKPVTQRGVIEIVEELTRRGGLKGATA